MLGSLNLSNGFSVSSPFPIYQQLNEPTKKEGLWVKTNNKIKDIYIGNTAETMSHKYVKLNDLPYSFSYGDIVTIDKNIYIFGGVGNKQLAYKYDIESGVYTKLAIIPYKFAQASAVPVGTNIYLLGSGESGYYSSAYVYDTLTDTYTSIKGLSIEGTFSKAVTIGNKIYIIGGNRSQKTICTYDTLINSYTTNHNFLPYDFYTGTIALIENDIYIYYGTKVTKYNVDTQVFTELSETPFSVASGEAVVLNNNVYITGIGSDYKRVLKHDTITDEYTEMESSPVELQYHGSVIYGNDIYLFKGTNAYKLKLNPVYTPGIYLFLNFEDSSGVGGFLMKNLHKNITKVQAYSETEKIICECYIGDGNSWNIVGGGVVLLNYFKKLATSFVNLFRRLALC